MLAWDRAHPADKVDPRVAEWRETHPAGTLEDLVRDLGLWNKPGDEDAQRLAWYSLRRLKDPAAMEGFHAMRNAVAAHVPAVRDTVPRRSSPRDGAATGCAAGTPQTAESAP
jgi:hypothetical protein